MRHLPLAPVSALLVLMLLFAGCTGGPEGPGGDGDGDAPDGNGDSDPDPDDPPARDDTDNGIAPPTEQREDDPDDVDRPGEYALLPRAEEHSDERWTVPKWSEGDTWRYRHHWTAGGLSCDPETEDVVTGTGTTWEVPVYQIEHKEIDCEDGSTAGMRAQNFSQSALVQLQDNGYIEHTFVFPLEDGQRWIYARDDGRGGTQNSTAVARHVAEYQWPDATDSVEAWYVNIEYEGEGDVEMRYWIGVEEKNILRREIWADMEGVHSRFFTTTLVSYTPG